MWNGLLQAGGNKPFKDFMAAYGPQGGYAPGASPHETYHCWAATEYKAKVRWESYAIHSIYSASWSQG